jgi:hypothetical protein
MARKKNSSRVAGSFLLKKFDYMIETKREKIELKNSLKVTRSKNLTLK